MKILAIALSLGAAIAAGPAFAQHDHAGHGAAASASASMLASSTPSDGAVLDRSPRTLVLAFAHPVILQTVRITGSNGAPIQATFRRASTPTAVFSVALPPQLGADAYRVAWTASGGGHSMQGDLSFTVQ